jgi:hypothetical protein
VRIASEGRKYGLYLLVVTQRPQKVRENVVSQCDSLALMRMNSLGDLDYVGEVFSHARVVGTRVNNARCNRPTASVFLPPMRVRSGMQVHPDGMMSAASGAASLC